MTTSIISEQKPLSWGLGLGLLTVAAILLDVLFFSMTLEDAQITYRYALRFAEGYDFGMWNRTGAPVEGFTTFIWMIYLSLFGPNLEAIVYASKITGMVAHVAIVVLFFNLYRAFDSAANGKQTLAINLFKGNEAVAADAFLYASMAVALFVPLAWYATTGMETLLFIALIAYVVFLPMLTGNWLLLAAVSVMLVLTRPDGLLFAFAAALYYWLVSKGVSKGLSKDKKFIWVAATVIFTFAALTLFRYHYFGHMMPNTYYAKSANAIGLMHIKAGVLYFYEYFVNYFYLFIPVGVLLLKSLIEKKWLEHGFALLVFAGIVVYFLIIAKAGGDNHSAFPFWRHTLNVFPLLVFCTFFSLGAISSQYGRRFSLVTVALLFCMPLILSYPQKQTQGLQKYLASSLASFPDVSNRYNDNPLLLWLKQFSNEETKISTSLAGELPLTLDAYHIDVLGLNDAAIAHNGSFDIEGPLDSKTDMDYVLTQRPDIIEGYMKAKLILQQQDLLNVVSARKKMNLDTLLHPVFQQEYMIISNAPYQSFDRILFINKQYHQSLDNREMIEVQPITHLVSVATQLVTGSTTLGLQ